MTPKQATVRAEVWVPLFTVFVASFVASVHTFRLGMLIYCHEILFSGLLLGVVPLVGHLPVLVFGKKQTKFRPNKAEFKVGLLKPVVGLLKPVCALFETFDLYLMSLWFGVHVMTFVM
jgi:hypothetical protein